MVRLLGIDPGTVRCGVAVSTRDATMAFPREALASGVDLMANVRRLVDEEGIECVVVGRPLALAGHETASTRAADELYDQLRRELAPTPVVQWDERLTTLEAQRSLTAAGVSAKESRAHIDSAAAVVLVQSYAEAHREA